MSTEWRARKELEQEGRAMVILPSSSKCAALRWLADEVDIIVMLTWRAEPLWILDPRFHVDPPMGYFPVGSHVESETRQQNKVLSFPVQSSGLPRSQSPSDDLTTDD